MGALSSLNAGAIVGNIPLTNFNSGTDAGANSSWHGSGTLGAWLHDQIPISAAGGTVDAITATFGTPNITLVDKTMVAVISAGANTSTTPTLSCDGTTAKTITMQGGQALAAGSIGPAGFVGLYEYNSANTRWELLNPVAPVMTATKSGLVPTPPNNTTTFLRGDGTFNIPSASIGASVSYLGQVVANNSATIDIEGIDGTYDNYLILGKGIVQANAGGSLNILLKIGGSYLTTATYYYNNIQLDSSTTTVYGNSSAAASLIDTTTPMGNAAGKSFDFMCTFGMAASTAIAKKIEYQLVNIGNTANIYQSNGVAYNTGTSALSGVRLVMSSDVITSGTFRLFGFKNS